MHVLYGLAVAQAAISTLELEDSGSTLLLNLTLGTPDQLVQVVVDTGSSYLWMYDEHQAGGFRANESSSWTPNGTDFTVRYYGDAYAEGWLGSDVLHLGNQTARIPIGLATSGNASQAILGLGQGSPVLAVLPESSGVYSLSLDPIMGNYLVIGGVDRMQRLSTVPMVDSSVSVMLHGVGYGGQCVARFAAPALLDTGTTHTHLPSELLNALAQRLNATWDDGWVVDCTAQFGIDLNFSGNLITTQWADIIEHDGNVCKLALREADRIIIGLDALRSMDLVVDLDRRQVSLGNHFSGNVDIGEVPSYPQAPGYSQTASAGVTLCSRQGASASASMSTSTSSGWRLRPSLLYLLMSVL